MKENTPGSFNNIFIIKIKNEKKQNTFMKFSLLWVLLTNLVASGLCMKHIFEVNNSDHKLNHLQLLFPPSQ